MSFGDQLKRVLDETGITPYKFSKMIGKDQSYISKVINGNVNVSYEMVELCAKTLGISPAQFFLSTSDQEEYLGMMLAELPPDLKQFILSQSSGPYLEMAKELKDSGLNPTTLQKMVELWKEAVESGRK